jgi:hypothetical protein
MTIYRELTEGERQRIHDRREGALWYAWGREDAGDRRLRDVENATTTAGPYPCLAIAFAQFAAAQCEDYVREQVSSLAPIQGQHDRYVAALTPGTQLRCNATGDVYQVVNYNATIHKVDVRVILSPGGQSGGSLGVGYTFTLSPEQVAGPNYWPVSLPDLAEA